MKEDLELLSHEEIGSEDLAEIVFLLVKRWFGELEEIFFLLVKRWFGEPGGNILPL